MADQEIADVLAALSELREEYRKTNDETRKTNEAMNLRLTLIEDRENRGGWPKYWRDVSVQCWPKLISAVGISFVLFVWLMIQGGWTP